MPLPIRTPNSLWQQIIELSALSKEQHVNQVNQSSSQPAYANDKSRQNMSRTEEMDTPSCTEDLKLTMMGLKDNRHEITKSVAKLSLMIILKEADRILRLRTLKFLISNPDAEIKTIRHHINKLASTKKGTEIHTQIDSIIKIEQVTFRPTVPTTVSKLSITSMLDQRTQILKNKIVQQSNNLPTPNSVQYIDNQGQDVKNTLSRLFPLYS